MYALFEDAGKFLAGRVMSEAESSMQVELDSGKRVKVKSANVLLRFDKPAPAELIASAQVLARDIDLDLAWEFAPEQEFGFVDLARDYFDSSAGVAQQAAPLGLERPVRHRVAGRLAVGDRGRRGLGDARLLAWLAHAGEERLHLPGDPDGAVGREELG